MLWKSEQHNNKILQAKPYLNDSYKSMTSFMNLSLNKHTKWPWEYIVTKPQLLHWEKLNILLFSSPMNEYVTNVSK